MSIYLGISAVVPLKNYRLLLTFENGEQRVFDVSPYLSKGIFSELRDEAIFQSVHVQFDSIEWSNGADFDPEMLYSESRLADKSILSEAA